MPGFIELLIIFIIVVLLFGASRLPRLGAALGKTVKNFRRASASRDDIEVEQVERKDLPPGGDA